MSDKDRIVKVLDIDKVLRKYNKIYYAIYNE